MIQTQLLKADKPYQIITAAGMGSGTDVYFIDFYNKNL
jgi:hypothetical protein